MFTSEDITKFEAFDNYNFDKDEQFQLGISSLLNNKQDNEVELVERAKIFYYTKFIENFDIEEYKTWKKGSQETMMKGKDMNEKENSATRFTFQEIVDMIEKGIEIPGIKQIPNVLNEGTPSESKMLARPKPWEMKK
ncbi:uncharacterized protein BX663DRAFT_505852 [Cokeromyces recurvatus]|uniref:uncharacterized protein n=1 Tax=Cokeromyces recurvatus TaxID=90255 RepID=UPI00222095C0|nr:uncharacterized protein BX663DRAFT_505852 [Cokeromyces recurvatus]KAI7903953.1 hypothetical protein BX663DRAFT_505852 [Cokeromyces recurvatus]